MTGFHIFNNTPYNILNNNNGVYMDYKCMNNSVQKDKQVPSMAYVPWQHWESLYEPDKALVRGTLFAILDKPFKGGCR